MTIEEMKQKGKELILLTEAKNVHSFIKPHSDIVYGYINSTTIQDLLERIGNYIKLNINLQDNDWNAAIQERFPTNLDVESLRYILKAYKDNNDTNLGLDNYLDSRDNIHNINKQVEFCLHHMNNIYMYNIKKEYLLEPLTDYTKDMFAYNVTYTLSLLMLNAVAKNSYEGIPYKYFMSELTTLGRHKKFLDDKDFEYEYTYDLIGYNLGGFGLYNVVRGSSKSNYPLGKIAYLFYHGLTVGVSMDHYFKIIDQMIENLNKANDPDIRPEDTEELEVPELTDEDKLGMIKGHIVYTLKKAKADGLQVDQEYIDSIVEQVTK